jgi:hypothetical protein
MRCLIRHRAESVRIRPFQKCGHQPGVRASPERLRTQLGVLRRPSDGAVPQKIAWIQCVGSRDVSAGKPYCSSVCCMYAMKQVILSKEHIPPLEAVILHNDVRAFGKDLSGIMIGPGPWKGSGLNGQNRPL